MSSKPAGPLLRIWQVWKSLRLPWRKRFFVGQDPSGNTYYELRLPRGDAPASAANRRLVHYPRSTHLSEVRVPPAWHQWLRHQRSDPPSMQEQLGELQRQARIKVLAAEADARWEAKDSLLDMPKETSAGTHTKGVGEKTTKGTAEMEGRGEIGVRESKEVGGGKTETQKPDPDPWKRAATPSAPGETWQPEAWTPAPAKKR
ncbi:hypothetical protein F4808DRAFT_425187 [Astrocystis sublimbata]|nr:hypothetical protein F4808DRAFT_425187 [Astrocystis sublimbata]